MGLRQAARKRKRASAPTGGMSARKSAPSSAFIASSSFVATASPKAFIAASATRHFCCAKAAAWPRAASTRRRAEFAISSPAPAAPRPPPPNPPRPAPNRLSLPRRRRNHRRDSSRGIGCSNGRVEVALRGGSAADAVEGAVAAPGSAAVEVLGRSPAPSRPRKSPRVSAPRPPFRIFPASGIAIRDTLRWLASCCQRSPPHLAAIEILVDVDRRLMFMFQLLLPQCSART